MKQKFMKLPKRSHIRMKISTWNKDSHGLYDFQSDCENYRNQIFYIDASTVIFRNLYNSCPERKSPLTILQFESDLRKTRDSFMDIGKVSIERKSKKSQFRFSPAVRKQDNDASYDQAKVFYRVIRQNDPDNPTNPGFLLTPGNIIRMGRVEYIVIEIKNNVETLTIRDTNHLNKSTGVFDIQLNKQIEPSSQDGNQIRCKVCLCSEETDDDPLISPCLCKGSVAKIHVGCLKQWINSKVKKEVNDLAYSYNFTKFECQICKTPFPQFVKLPKGQIQMMTIHKPNTPYIILQSLIRNKPADDLNKEQRCLHVICAKQDVPVKMGRGHQCEIRLTDISVSRSHAQIVFDKGQFLIKDNKSKFGTLIKLDESIVLKRNEVIKVQYGRSIYEMSVEGEISGSDTE